jgi:hypothetical protein
MAKTLKRSFPFVCNSQNNIVSHRSNSQVQFVLSFCYPFESGKFVAILARIEVANGFSLRKLTNNASSLPCDTFFLPVPCFFPMVPVCANLRFANNTVFLSTLISLAMALIITPSLSLVMITLFANQIIAAFQKLRTTLI